MLGYSLLGVYPCAVWKTNAAPGSKPNCECSSGGPVRATRLATTSLRAVPYPQPTLQHQPTQAVAPASSSSTQAAAAPLPDSTVQPEPSSSVAEVSTTSDPQPTIPSEYCHPFFQPTQAKIACSQSSIAIPFTPGTALPVIQNVIPVEYPNGVIANVPPSGGTANCLPVGQCYAGVIPQNTATACLPVAPRFQAPVVNNAIPVSDCRCQAEGNDCCHASIAPYPPTTTASMLFVPYSLPNFPPQYRSNIAASTSPCSGTTPVKVSSNILILFTTFPSLFTVFLSFDIYCSILPQDCTSSP